jgi:cytochrome P450
MPERFSQKTCSARLHQIRDYDSSVFVESREDLFAVVSSNFPGAAEIRGERGVPLMGGTAHHRVHAFLMRWFSTPLINQQRESLMRSIVNQLIDMFIDRGAAELAVEFAAPLARRVMAGMIGLPWQDDEFIALLQDWDDAVSPWLSTLGEDEVTRERACACAAIATERIVSVVRARRDRPRADFISALWEHGLSLCQEWGEDDVVDQCRMLFLAGNQVVAYLVATAAYLLVADRVLWGRLLAERSALPAFVEEVVRLYPPTQPRLRRATRDIEIRGQRISAGDWILIQTAEANRDPCRFPEPRCIDLNRGPKGKHLSFTVGPRHCVGALLGRAEVIEAMDGLLTRLRDPYLDQDAPPPRYVQGRFSGIRPIYIRFSI